MKKLICLAVFLTGIFFAEISFVSAASSAEQQERSGFRDPFLEKQTGNGSNAFGEQGNNSSEDGGLRNGIGEINAPVTDGLYVVLILGAAYAVYCCRRMPVKRSKTSGM
jgi:hypothetical protein